MDDFTFRIFQDISGKWWYEMEHYFIDEVGYKFITRVETHLIN